MKSIKAKRLKIGKPKRSRIKALTKTKKKIRLPSIQMPKLKLPSFKLPSISIEKHEDNGIPKNKYNAAKIPLVAKVIIVIIILVIIFLFVSNFPSAKLGRIDFYQESITVERYKYPFYVFNIEKYVKDGKEIDDNKVIMDKGQWQVQEYMYAGHHLQYPNIPEFRFYFDYIRKKHFKYNYVTPYYRVELEVNKNKAEFMFVDIDNEKSPEELVVIKNSKDEEITGWTYSEKKGCYVIKVKCNQAFKVTFNDIGYTVIMDS